MSLKRFLHPRQAPYLFPSPYLLPSFLLCFPPLLSCASFLPSFLYCCPSLLPFLLCFIPLYFFAISLVPSSSSLPSLYSFPYASFLPFLIPPFLFLIPPFSYFPYFLSLDFFFFLKKEKCLPFLLLYFRLCFPSFLPSLLSHRLTSSPIPSFLSSLTSRILPCLMLFSLFPYTPPNRLNNIWQHFRSAPDSASFASLSSR